MSRVDKQKDIIICDLDGTIADEEHRAKKYLQGREPADRDWNGYYADCSNDKPVEAVITVLKGMWALGLDIIIMSGRRADTIEQTEEWLRTYQVPYDQLWLRPVDDRTQDTELKPAWVRELGIQERILFVLEDRERMVKAWRDLGIPCFQVAPGKF